MSALEPPEDGPELFIALAGAVGADLQSVGLELESALRERGYRVQSVQLSSLLDLLEWNRADAPVIDDSTLDRHIDSRMEAGDRFREALRRGDALASLAIAAVRACRDDPDIPEARTAYVLRSVKHPDEVHTLRNVYGPNFFLISAASSRDSRESYLAGRISASWAATTKSTVYKGELSPQDRAKQLIARDQREPNRPNGQRLGDAFPLADAFVNAGSESDLHSDIKRFVETVFDHPYHTPTRDENAMFHAQAAALRSAAPSRQVGAVITTGGGEVVAVGANEVPRAGGGQYWGEDEDGQRDHQRTEPDISRQKKRAILDQILSRMKEDKWLTDERMTAESDEFYELTRGLQVHDLIEFGRAVHAEMAALIDAARRGVSVQDNTLYSTTFPCHECARHIIAGGIRRVVYIEPYPKSLTEDLHEDAVEVDKSKVSDPAKVRFDPFIGIAPRRYLELFTPRPGVRRNEDGVMGVAAAGWFPKCVPGAFRDEAQRRSLLLAEAEERDTAFLEIVAGVEPVQQELVLEVVNEDRETTVLTSAEALDLTSDELYIVREQNEIEALDTDLELSGLRLKDEPIKETEQ